ncbi:MAG: UDP-glucose 4-epimerase GalE [Patescibacteria group bacterium]
MMKILVTGGAGYIGSFAAKRLIGDGHMVIVFDNLERGHRESIVPQAKFIKGDLRSVSDVENLFSIDSFDAIMHFAGYISVEESSRNPDLYYENNVVGSKNLFDIAVGLGKVNKIIFSSTAAVYGNPVEIPIPEDHPKNPVSPYGKTKLETEEYLITLNKSNPSVGFVSLRYFNASGAALDGSMGEDHDPETHIIPLAIKSLISGSEFNLYGTDYDTSDGTCIRDYIHVIDLVEAHIIALKELDKNSKASFYNVGTGKGVSNKEVIDMIEEVSGKKLKINKENRRSGDADRLIADPSKINKELNFRPKYSDLKTIVESAWKWHTKQI